ncbi:MAG: hypothetical protein RJA31_1139, partial [Actinomycetota bacterium]
MCSNARSNDITTTVIAGKGLSVKRIELLGRLESPRHERHHHTTHIEQTAAHAVCTVVVEDVLPPVTN